MSWLRPWPRWEVQAASSQVRLLIPAPTRLPACPFSSTDNGGYVATPTAAPLDAAPVYIGTELPDAGFGYTPTYCSGETKQIILSVKSGHVNVSHVRDLGHGVKREKARIGVLICMIEPTRAMRTEASSADSHRTP
jgi:hypothetical protein